MGCGDVSDQPHPGQVKTMGISSSCRRAGEEVPPDGAEPTLVLKGPLGYGKGYSSFNDHEWARAVQCETRHRSMRLSALHVWANDRFVVAIRASYATVDTTGFPRAILAPKHGDQLTPELGKWSPSSETFYRLRGCGAMSHTTFALRDGEIFDALQATVTHIHDGVNRDGHLVLSRSQQTAVALRLQFRALFRLLSVIF